MLLCSFEGKIAGLDIFIPVKSFRAVAGYAKYRDEE
jgi:hypothetical protein